MGTLAQELEFGVLSTVDPDEPIFVIRAQDELAAITIDYWIAMAATLNVNEPKLASARLTREAMRMWKKKKTPT